MSDREAILRGRVAEQVKQAAGTKEATQAAASNTNEAKPDTRGFRFHPWLNIWFYGTELQHAQARLTYFISVFGIASVSIAVGVAITDLVHVGAGAALFMAFGTIFAALLMVRLLMRV